MPCVGYLLTHLMLRWTPSRSLICFAPRLQDQQWPVRYLSVVCCEDVIWLISWSLLLSGFIIATTNVSSSSIWIKIYGSKATVCSLRVVLLFAPLIVCKQWATDETQRFTTFPPRNSKLSSYSALNLRFSLPYFHFLLMKVCSLLSHKIRDTNYT